MADIDLDDRSKRPDLPEIMAFGLGVSEALRFWNQMMNAPEVPISAFWTSLERIKAIREFPSSSPPPQRLQ